MANERSEKRAIATGRPYGENTRIQKYGYIGNGVTETYSYDYANRLTSYVRQTETVPPDPPIIVAYAYSFMPTGERVSKQDLSSPTTRWFMYDQWEVVTEYTQAGAGSLSLDRSYVNGSKIARIGGGGGGTYYYIPNVEGSVAHLTSGTSISNTTRYYAFGEMTPANYAIADPYKYRSSRYDDESGINHIEGIIYNPIAAQILNTIMNGVLANTACHRSLQNQPLLVTCKPASVVPD